MAIKKRRKSRLARIVPVRERRALERRRDTKEPVLSGMKVFELSERQAFKSFDRRKELRRSVDVKRRTAGL